MDIARVLLGHPWIYDKNATKFAKDNTHMFTHNRQRIRLVTTRLQDHNKNKRATFESPNSNK